MQCALAKLCETFRKVFCGGEEVFSKNIKCTCCQDYWLVTVVWSDFCVVTASVQNYVHEVCHCATFVMMFSDKIGLILIYLFRKLFALLPRFFNHLLFTFFLGQGQILKLGVIPSNFSISLWTASWHVNFQHFIRFANGSRCILNSFWTVFTFQGNAVMHF